ncbi:hypothetical protein LJR010_005910 [Ensifer adhaerens]|nr:hypothetical protein [Ensifer sp. ENS02]MBD9524957.1 hypothetical protein [Ensifer sp. ENS02]
MGLTSEIEVLNADLAEHGLVDFIARNQVRIVDEGYDALLANLATILNNKGASSFTDEFGDSLEKLPGPRFFLVQHVFCDLIPRLELDHLPILHLVDKLVRQGGSDIAAGQPNVALRNWCALDPRRSAAIYADARSGGALALRHLTFALEAHNAVDEAIGFAHCDLKEAQFAAATALGRMNLGSEFKRALDTLVELANADDENLSLTGLHAGFSATTLAGEKLSSDLENALAWRMNVETPQTIYLAADLLWKHPAVLTPRALQLCLAAVEAVAPQYGGTVQHLDFATRSLAELGQLDRMVELVGKICDRTNGAISLSSFGGLLRQLEANGPDALGRAVVFWLINGELHIRNSLASELTDIGRDVPSYSVPADCLPADAATQLFLCRKAVGWFFSDPLSAAPILLSVLRHGSREVAGDVCDLIFDPLLLSYGGKFKDYLEAQTQGDDALSASLLKLIEAKNAVHEAADGVETLVELRPSERQHEAERALWQEQMKDGMESANKRSVFADLFTTQYILYGRSSLYAVDRGDGHKELVQSELSAFSVSAELPLLDIFDPAGLRHSLYQMKFEERSEL